LGVLTGRQWRSTGLSRC